MKSLSNYKPYTTMYIDAMNLLTRSFYGMSDLEYKGHKTGMLYGVVRLVLDWRLRNPGIDIVMVWEGRDSWRREKYPIYKGHRAGSHPAKDTKAFFDSIERVKYALPPMGVRQAWADTYEADDTVSALAQYSYRRGDRSLFSSGDWDWWELSAMGDILYQHRDIMVQRDLDAMFVRKFKADPVPPDTLWMFKVLTGDASDNVSGVPRFPRKLASRLCNIDNIGPGDFVHGLITLGEESWAQKLSDQYWIIERNSELLRSSEVPLDDIDHVDGSYDAVAFGSILLNSGMSSLYDKFSREL